MNCLNHCADVGRVAPARIQWTSRIPETFIRTGTGEF